MREWERGKVRDKVNDGEREEKREEEREKEREIDRERERQWERESGTTTITITIIFSKEKKEEDIWLPLLIFITLFSTAIHIISFPNGILDFCID